MYGLAVWAGCMGWLYGHMGTIATMLVLYSTLSNIIVTIGMSESSNVMLLHTYRCTLPGCPDML